MPLQRRLPKRGFKSHLLKYNAEITLTTLSRLDLAEVDVRTMESKLHPGLFFAGEVLDVDGRIEALKGIDLAYVYVPSERGAFRCLGRVLKIKCDGLGDTKIFHIGGHLETHFFANPKIMVDCTFACKNYCTVFLEIDFLFAEIFIKGFW
jgi:hypothetical protein